jgi:hypothetical protein
MYQPALRLKLLRRNRLAELLDILHRSCLMLLRKPQRTNHENRDRLSPEQTDYLRETLTGPVVSRENEIVMAQLESREQPMAQEKLTYTENEGQQLTGLRVKTLQGWRYQN